MVCSEEISIIGHCQHGEKIRVLDPFTMKDFQAKEVFPGTDSHSSCSSLKRSSGGSELFPVRMARILDQSVRIAIQNPHELGNLGKDCGVESMITLGLSDCLASFICSGFQVLWCRSSY
jgi:hypothetical protein